MFIVYKNWKSGFVSSVSFGNVHWLQKKLTLTLQHFKPDFRFFKQNEHVEIMLTIFVKCCLVNYDSPFIGI